MFMWYTIHTVGGVMMAQVRYPNLELLEYQFQQMLDFDISWKRKLNDGQLEFDVIVFLQAWASTNTGFDVTPNGESTVGGDAVTQAYTVVVHESSTNTYGVFVDNRFCYMVSDPTETFYEDLKERNIACLSVARTRY